MRDATVHSVRRHYRKLHKQARHLIRGMCPGCNGCGYDFAGDDCTQCHSTGKVETDAWVAFLLLRGAPRWLVNGEASAPDDEGSMQHE